MDPTCARCLQVRAEDHTEADLMFTTLMAIRSSHAESSSKTTVGCQNLDVDLPYTQTGHIEDEMKRSYMDYAHERNRGTSVPDARDGLKPAHRRVLSA